MSERIDAMRQALEARLATLTARTERIESHLRTPGARDSEEQALETQNDEVLERLDETELREIDDIRAALQRIEAGTYQACSSCGGAIAPGRLEALPYTSLCIGCAD